MIDQGFNLYYFGQGFNCISIPESISSHTEGKKSHLDDSIPFKNFMSYPHDDVYGDTVARDS